MSCRSFSAKSYFSFASLSRSSNCSTVAPCLHKKLNFQIVNLLRRHSPSLVFFKSICGGRHESFHLFNRSRILDAFTITKLLRDGCPFLYYCFRERLSKLDNHSYLELCPRVSRIFFQILESFVFFLDLVPPMLEKTIRLDPLRNSVLYLFLVK